MKTPLGSQIETMLQTVMPHVSSATYERLSRRVAAWQKSEQRLKESRPVKELPPLVMKSKGLPRRLDPFYFRLISTLHTPE